MLLKKFWILTPRGLISDFGFHNREFSRLSPLKWYENRFIIRCSRLCIIQTPFEMRYVSVILENVLHTQNVSVWPMKIFLRASKVKVFSKIHASCFWSSPSFTIFYQVVWVSGKDFDFRRVQKIFHVSYGSVPGIKNILLDQGNAAHFELCPCNQRNIFYWRNSEFRVDF